MSGISESSNPSTPSTTTVTQPIITSADVHPSNNPTSMLVQPLLDSGNGNIMLAQVSGEGSTEKPIAPHKHRVKRNRGPRIRGVAVANRSKKRKSKKIRAGNHQHIVDVSTVCDVGHPGFKAVHIAQRRTGRRRGPLDAATAAKADEA